MNPLDFLPDFEHFSYTLVKQPQPAKLLAWSKLKECERRLTMYKWVEQNNNPARPHQLVLLNDALSAFLLSFEAAIQHVADQYDARGIAPAFGQWLVQQPENNELVKGVRTLRHLEAHVQSYPVAGHIKAVIGGGPSSITRRWSLQELQINDIQRLDRPKLKTSSDLATWNSLVQSHNVNTLLSDALDRLNTLMLRLESIL